MYLELFFSKKLIKIYFITHIMSVNKSLINKKRRITDKKEKILSIILGIITGAINGLFGGGGGMIVVPMLIWLMKYEEKIAHATAILLILPLSIVSGIFYAVFGNFDINNYLDDISYDEMLELASLGANVLHNRSVEMAKKYKVKMSVRSSLNNNEGTYVKEVNQVEKMLVRGVTRDNDCARIALCGIEDTPGKAFEVFALLSKHNISVDLIIQSIGNGISKDISFTVSEGDCDEAVRILEDENNALKFDAIKWSKDVSKVSIVGTGMMSSVGVASTMFEALFNANININMIATSEIKISVLVDQKDAERAVVAIHDKFMI